MIRSLKLAAFTAVCFAVVAAPAFGAKGAGTATISFANSGSAATSAPTAGSSVSFAVTANVKPADVYSLWVANVCSLNGVTVSAEYHPVQNWTAGTFTASASGTTCTAFVWMFPDAWTALKGGSMTYSVN